MDGSASPRKRYQDSAERQIARLTLEQALITLIYSGKAAGTKVAALYGAGNNASLSSHQELLRCALSEAGLVAENAARVDASQLPDVRVLKTVLSAAEALVILDDQDFRDAPFAKSHMLNAFYEHANLPRIVLRHGDISGHDDLEFYLRDARILHLSEPEHWQLVPAFLMEAVALRKP